MKRAIGALIIVALAASCKPGGAEKQKQAIAEEQGIVYEEYTGTEPTTPEETELYRPVPPRVDPYGNEGAPSDATILFDGSSFDQWVMVNDSSEVNWHLNEDGSMTVKDKTGDIMTKAKFGDVQLHIEWRSPADVQQDGQNRANSGVFLQGLYEVQVLDNNDNETYVNGQVASVYKQHIPLAMASVPSGEWNTYDIIYHAPEFDDSGNKTKSGTITVLHNGVLVQDHVEIKGTTPNIGWPKNPPHGKGPIRLQDHGDNSRVSYRNIWVREL
jgi:hypothetical protein